MIRKANLNDLNALVDIENLSFDYDLITKRNFQYLLTRANAETIVEEENGMILGYAMLLFHTGTSLARLYSFAVLPKHRKKKIGTRFFREIEKISLEHDCFFIRMEVKTTNEPSKRLAEKFGYRQIGFEPEYYEDKSDAYRLEKSLHTRIEPKIAKVPYYEQTLEFTCGPACLMMAMKTLKSDSPLDRKTELRLWRESTTIFMTAGHGGCGPYGLALSAFNRGFKVDLYIKGDPKVLFLDTVRSKYKKEVIKLVQEDLKEQVSKLPIKMITRGLSIPEIEETFKKGHIPIILVSSYRINREKTPHWVIITGIDEKYIFIHDPYVSYEHSKSQTDCINIPIIKKEFDQISRYGKSIQKAALIIKL